MDLEKVKEIILSKNALIIVFTILISIIIIKTKDKIISVTVKKVERQKTRDNRRKMTYLKLISSVVNYVVLLIALVIVLQIFGINVSSIIAGLGVVSVIAGLALQDALKDIIMGVNILIDNYYSVGDVIKIDDVEGKIMEIGLKTTKLKDVNNENILVIANRNIVQALTLSEQLDIDIPLPYERKVLEIEEVIEEILFEVRKNNMIKDIKYLGVNEFGASSINYKIRVWTLPENKPVVKRYLLRQIKLTLDEKGIEIPYTQIDIHKK